MKNIVIRSCLIALLSLNTGLLASEEPSLNPNLQPLKTYLGEWKICWTDANGQHRSGKASFKPDAGGAIMIFKSELLGPDEKPFFTRTSVFYWNGEENSLAESHFTSDCGY